MPPSNHRYVRLRAVRTLMLFFAAATAGVVIGCGQARHPLDGARQKSMGGAEKAAKKLMDAAPMPAKENAEHNTEAYDHIVENVFLPADRNPLSTFSIDVDTASYSNVRRFLLNENRLPPPDAVRIEELVNYFPYRYPQPKGGQPVSFTLDLAECPWNAKHYLVRIGLMA